MKAQQTTNLRVTGLCEVKGWEVFELGFLKTSIALSRKHDKKV
jgi:hypothetical protein